MPTTHTNPPTRRRWALAALLLLILAVLGLLAASVGSGAPTAASPTTESDSAENRRSGNDDKRGATDAEPTGSSTGGPTVDPNPDPGDPGPVDFDGEDGTDPCADHDSADGALLVGPDPLVLPSGEMDGELHVRNCGAGAIGWVAATKPSVILATTSGTLDPGEVFPIELSIDGSQWEPGAIAFKVKVSEADYAHNTYVDVQAFRPLVGADVVATDEISAGAGEGGCSLQCITRAKLSTGYSSPDVGLDVRTTVPAKVRVYLSKNPPVIDQDGNPTFPGQPPKETSPDGVQSWKTTLADLQPTTKYFIIVKATDGDGDTAYQHGSFKTVTPVAQDGSFATGGEEPGCSAGCLTQATVTPGDGSDPAKVTVRSHTPATFELMLSLQPPTTKDGHPHFEKKAVWHSSGLDYLEAWDNEVNGLQPATTYYGIVSARDANGQRSYATGEFTTDGIDIVITVHRIHVSHDGDTSAGNRGELRFVWGAGESVAGIRSEGKVASGDDIHFGRSHSAHVVWDAQGELPIVNVTAIERDAYGTGGYCSLGDGLRPTHGSSKECGWKWDVAIGGAVVAGDLDRLPDCTHYGVTEEWTTGCVLIESGDHGEDHPQFSVVVSYSYADW